jgi:hypothetical protein
MSKTMPISELRHGCLSSSPESRSGKKSRLSITRDDDLGCLVNYNEYERLKATLVF